ncbi:uncharacterized protein Z520_12368 [Fonsecaea multimorphosa CBS 102226]|uniref:Uncharacterized protein n=1 Tax=Fonsecaea multimorphosa CBS 102226 TaxID=1442371 RepID=A0A0D2JFI6_9EURO|nr:uncharacterized protein Z520_12368 [Fonsecaea multimorphosa CBS 102226]KIX91932.1 hypothetical protein Z520_12368 [Fonsecaea multimorphosa CBS 102226]OAL24923.1 hypothetical protein AYO22_05259 [Fonsecaea multimorphosa]
MLAPPGTALPKLKRCLAELLRTCVHPSALLLRVEHVFGKAQAGSHRNRAVERDDEQDDDQDQILINTGVDHGNESVPGSDDTWCVRLAVSDGHLQIQAVISPALLFETKELWELQRGDLIEVHKFQVRSAPRVSGKGRVIYLGIRDCEWVGRDRDKAEESEGKDGLELEGGFLREEQDDMFRRKPNALGEDLTAASDKSGTKRRDAGDRAIRVHPSKNTQSKPNSSKLAQKASRNPSEDDSDDDQGFDTIFVSQSRLEQRRQALRQIQQPPSSTEEATVSRLQRGGEQNQGVTQSDFAGTSVVSTSNRSHRDIEDHDGNQPISEVTATHSYNSLAHPHHQPTDLAGSNTPPAPHEDPSTHPSNTTSVSPIDSLASLLALPIQKSYSCSVLALISWVSPSLIHRPNTPFPPKRHIKIHDPSISHRTSGVTVFVFVDAQTFLPSVGTVALFSGLVMNRVRRGSADGEGDVILNKYPTKMGSQKVENEDGESAGAYDGESGGEGQGQGEWFICDEARLVGMGFDVHRIKMWWEQRLAARKSK